MQKEKSKKTFEDVVNREISITMARVQLKYLYLPGDAINLILNTAMIIHDNKTDALNMHDLSDFHHLIDKRNFNELDFSNFTTHRRQNLMLKSLVLVLCMC